MAPEGQATWIGRLKNAPYSKMAYLLWINRSHLLFRRFGTAIYLFSILKWLYENIYKEINLLYSPIALYAYLYGILT